MGNSPSDVAHIEGLRGSLIDHGYAITESSADLGSAALIGRRPEFRWAWAATRLHTFVMAFVERELSVIRAQELIQNAQDYAITHKGGLPRGMQTGTATLPTFLTHGAPAETVQWFQREPQHQRAALVLPVLADLTAGEITWFKGHMRRGYYFERHLREVAGRVIAPGLT